MFCYTKFMKRYFILTLVLVSFIYAFLVVGNINAQVRWAECDMCGYCWRFIPTPPQTNPPGNWEPCRKCLYEDTIGFSATENKTLEIDATTNNPPTPYPGHMYTMIGCLSTNLTDFTQQGAAGNIVNYILNRLIFPLSGGIALLYLIYGAFLIMTSQADAERLNQGKRVVTGSIIGLVFVLFTVFLVNIVAYVILKIPR